MTKLFIVPNWLNFDNNQFKLQRMPTRHEHQRHLLKWKKFLSDISNVVQSKISIRFISAKFKVWHFSHASFYQFISHLESKYATSFCRSFGVVLWEMLTGEVPYKDVDSSAIIWGVGNNSLQLPIPDGCPDSFKLLLRQCWWASGKGGGGSRDEGKRNDMEKDSWGISTKRI